MQSALFDWAECTGIRISLADLDRTLSFPASETGLRRPASGENSASLGFLCVVGSLRLEHAGTGLEKLWLLSEAPGELSQAVDLVLCDHTVDCFNSSKSSACVSGNFRVNSFTPCSNLSNRDKESELRT